MDAPSSAMRAAQHRRSEYLAGVALLLLVVLLWTGSNFLTNTMLTGAYNKPFAVTYLNTSSFALYLIPFACARSRKRRNAKDDGAQEESFWARVGFRLPEEGRRDVEDSTSRGRYDALPSEIEPAQAVRQRRPASPSFPRGSLEVQPLLPRPSSIDGRRPRSIIDVSAGSSQPVVSLAPAAPLVEPPLTFSETGWLAAQFTLVWFAANWSLNAGLGLTSVASGTTLSSASGFFTLALGSILGVEIFTLPKLFAVSLSFAGVVLVTRADSAQAGIGAPANAPLGDALALLSAFFYAAYVSLLKVRIGSEERVSMPLFFGFVGAFNVLGMWPIGLLLHLTGTEVVQVPADGMTWAGIGVNMCITFVSDFAYLLAMLKSSPLIATVGLSLTIPLAMLGDIARGSHSGGLQADAGSVMVLLSFVAVGLADNALLSRQVDSETAALPAGDSIPDIDAERPRGRAADR